MNARSNRMAERARIPMALRRLLAAAWAPGFGLPVAHAFAQSKADFSASAQGIVKALDLQTAFPNSAVAETSDVWLPGGDAARLLLWVAVAIGVVVIALYLRDILPGGGLARRKRWDASDAELQQAIGAEAEAQTNADELARLGRFVDAMHVLLLQALADMHRRLDVAIVDSLTSREILRRAKVSPLAKSALQEIIGAVERAYFGDYPAGESDYLSCRTSFATFVGALRSGGGA
ncbi:DUF4129 domain-containing protein [Methylocapsa sp. S129]|uniref:DUF4129 domain-containing protein n=1 Tax=Methylocapsa sp. S129 TaxID=1641869 RepID=UPI00131E2F7F|nr:DUF4129 domain-containing protein [Methylocapsa sp. S129]